MIDYGNLMHEAMRSLIRTVLQDVSENGLPGSHHFFITFDTRHPDAELADWLHDRYVEEMTVVIQHWFDNLTVEDGGFGVTLNFGDTPERLYVPFDAIKTFVDPSVEFGLRFETAEDDLEEDDARPHLVDDEPDADLDEDTSERDGEVVSLDSFRK